jgi:hypothetical protein
MPKSKLFLPHLLAQGIDAFGYGGLENFGANGYTDYADNWLRDYKWNLETGPRDRERAQMFIDDFNKRVANGRVAQFNWIFFPNNHTLGLQMGEPIPESMVADNDEAVGMVVDAVSHSPVWDESLIIVFEDDAQGAYDHIEKHRCPALAIGPWVKRGYVSAVQYSFPNFHRTVEAILGAAPMNRFDQKASPMYDIFTARPNTTPYDLIPRTPEVLYDGTNGGIGSDKLARSMDWSGIDRNENQAEFFWRYLGKGPLPPAAIRDAHFLPDD